MGVYVNTYGSAKVDLTDSQISNIVDEIFDMRPASIIDRLKLKSPIYSDTAAYGHMGRKPELKTITFSQNGESVELEVETFTWEKLDYVDKVKEAFKI